MNLIKIDNIIRLKRKTIALVINPDATLTVRAPIHISRGYIEQLVNKKRAWIERKIGEVKSRPRIRPKEFVDGEGFFYLGETYRLKITESSAISLEDYLYFPECMLSNASARLKAWYKARAAEKIEERVASRAKEIGLNYKSIKIVYIIYVGS